jgi:hypothetical protein
MTLQTLSDDLESLKSGSDDLVWQAHYSYLDNMIQSYMENPSTFSAPDAPYTPPGSPIGSGLHELLPTQACSFN